MPNDEIDDQVARISEASEKFALGHQELAKKRSAAMSRIVKDAELKKAEDLKKKLKGE